MALGIAAPWGHSPLYHTYYLLKNSLFDEIYVSEGGRKYFGVVTALHMHCSDVLLQGA